MKTLNLLTYLLVILGSITVMLQGVFGVDLLGTIFGSVTVISKLVYFLIGVSGIYMLTHFKTIVK
jgi:hypothetical protein